ncbi:hypothetical protein [Neobacillus vireti]|uniref:Uncharacterized protein n=1 Tax=Neobacillus vireti LMG 21834 TaxID=1131730 RepID=A0AB94IT35_9BACI|nr:hypothetical protein [Neobacillus vireti]ETI70123.1 hypothetical protein BAVI_03519 [Neobacillus vireti LMG 21834]KLT16496.1 hypothetical protein AA980_18710 [Neobacillus vireti]
MKGIAAGVLFAIMMLGVGTTYASSDAGEAISNWFHQSFLDRSCEIEASAANEMNASLKRIATDIQNSAQNAEEQLTDSQLKITSESERTIENHKNHYIQQLQAAKENLKKQNEQKMQLYKEQAEAREAAQISKDAEAILAELLKEQN